MQDEFQHPQKHKEVGEELIQELRKAMRIMPVKKDDPKHVAKRRSWFKYVDPNGNNLVSLSETHKAVRDVIKLPVLFAHKTVMNRSFRQAKKASRINDAVRNAIDQKLKAPENKINFMKLSLRLPAGSSFCEQMFRDKLFRKCSNGGEWVQKEDLIIAIVKTLKVDSYDLIQKQFNLAQTKACADEQKVDQKIFQKFLAQLRKLLELYSIFLESNSGSDMTLDFFEFKKALKHQHIRHNFILKLKKKDIDIKFKEVSGSDGQVDFHEFSDQVISTDMGNRDGQYYSQPKFPKETQDQNDDDFVTFKEFRILLEKLVRNLELQIMYFIIDFNLDKRIDLYEFGQAIENIEFWGYRIEDQRLEQRNIDKSGGGILLFDEFADWAESKKLKLPFIMQLTDDGEIDPREENYRQFDDKYYEKFENDKLNVEM